MGGGGVGWGGVGWGACGGMIHGRRGRRQRVVPSVDHAWGDGRHWAPAHARGNGLARRFLNTPPSPSMVWSGGGPHGDARRLQGLAPAAALFAAHRAALSLSSFDSWQSRLSVTLGHALVVARSPWARCLRLHPRSQRASPRIARHAHLKAEGSKEGHGIRERGEPCSTQHRPMTKPCPPGQVLEGETGTRGLASAHATGTTPQVRPARVSPGTGLDAKTHI